MKQFTNLLIIFAILLVCGKYSFGNPQHKQPPAPVATQKVIEMQFQEPVTFVGAVEPDQRSLVATEVAGLVADLLYEEGDFVKKGDVIAVLKQVSLQIQLHEAEAALKESEARLKYATKQTIRYDDLYKKSVVPIEELQQSQSERDAWAEKTIQYKAKIEKLAYDLEHMQIKAPFNGYIISKHTEIGEWRLKGAPVYELINLDSVHALVYVPEQLAVALNQNDPAKITLDAFPGMSIDGTVLAVIPQASLKARTLPVKVGFKNDGKKIKSGLLARVSFSSGNEAVSKLVPKDAIVMMNNQRFIYAVNNGVANPVPVKTGRAHGNLIEVFGPIELDMDIIIRGNERVRPGQAVMVQNNAH